jgi:transcription antitermination factor NusG
VSSENFEPGDPVEIVAGNLMGLTGELIEYEGIKRLFQGSIK